MSTIDSYSEQYNTFSRQLLEKYYSARRDQNLVFSPFSILAVLAIAAEATAGITREEIVRVLSAEMDLDSVVSALQEIQREITEKQAFRSANAVCVNNEIKNSIVLAFVTRIREQFEGELFASADIISDVNAWAAKKTDGMIDQIVDESMREMQACLLNAAAFDGKWMKPCTSRDIIYEKFRNSDGTTKKTSMLDIQEDLYVEDESVTGFVKPYKDIGFSFMALLPKKTGAAGLDRVMKSLSFSDLFRSRTSEPVDVLLPEFEYTFGEDLSSWLKELGIVELFSNRADFSPFSSEWLKMEAILHKARIEVNHSGTRAAAITAGVVCFGAAPHFDRKKVRLTRPFVYAIVHNYTALPVFVGVVNNL